MVDRGGLHHGDDRAGFPRRRCACANVDFCRSRPVDLPPRSNRSSISGTAPLGHRRSPYAGGRRRHPPSGVSCPMPASCMAVGTQISSTTPGTGRGLERLDLERDTHTPGDGDVGFSAVSCVGASFCSAVGEDQGPNPEVPVSEAWNGSSWTEAPPPPPPTGQSGLEGVSCFSATSHGSRISRSPPDGAYAHLGLHGERSIVDPDHEPAGSLWQRYQPGPLRCRLPERLGLCGGRGHLRSRHLRCHQPARRERPDRARATGSRPATAGSSASPPGVNSPASFLGASRNTAPADRRDGGHAGRRRLLRGGL